ncbi:ABC transporter ATP-binding protein [Verrucomicrobiota bacterium]
MGIVVENVSKAFEGKPVLDDVSFEIKDGEFATFLAPTGEGKTTLLRILAGVESPDSGRILYDGKDVTHVAVQKRNIAMVYQWFVNYPSMTVYDNMATPLRASASPLPADDMDAKIKATAALLKIDAFLDRLPSELSGGQQQRLALARALVKGADYIFLDEPLTNLDYKLQEELRAELKKIFETRDHGAVVLGSPQPIEALALSTSVGFLHGGRLVQFGPTDQVYHNPCSVDVAAYFCHPGMNLLDGRLVSENGTCWIEVSEELRIDVTEFKDRLEEDEYVLGIRPQALGTERVDGVSLPVHARVELSEVVGSDTELHLDHRGKSLISWVQGVETFDLGSELTVYVHPHRFFIFEKISGNLVAKTQKD